MNTQTTMTSRVSDYERMADAIDFLERNWRRRPGLDEVAERIGLSKYHFQRLFQRWAGISPKRFVQHLTVERARELLRGPRPVLDVAEQLDLSGAGRLHDLLVSVDAVTPGEVRRGGAGLAIGYGSGSSPFGPCLLGTTARGVCHLAFGDDPDPEIARRVLRRRWPAATLHEDQAGARDLVRRIFAPADGRRAPLPLLIRGTNFQLQVWEALLRIPPGQIVTYQEIAAAVGRPEAARAVGQAVGANPVSYLIPCHRVLRKDGGVSGYAWGIPRKRAMLCYELHRTQ